MGTRLAEVGDGVFQLMTYSEVMDFAVNQYRVVDDEPRCSTPAVQSRWQLLRHDDCRHRSPDAEDVFASMSLHPASAEVIRGLTSHEVRTLALMHGPMFTGGCRAALTARVPARMPPVYTYVVTDGEA